jgi:HD-like signal output (HDOD) protein
MSQNKELEFSLVSEFAAELSSGDLKLPSLPETVVRIKNALTQPDFTADQLARIITPEPALVGTILTMANSVAFKRSGNETTDLKIAISRIGAGMVQTAATTFALRQLKDSAEFAEAAHLLTPEWSRASRTAAVTYLIAQKTRQVQPDEALIVGLIHNIGRIYLLSRLPQYPALMDSEKDTAQLLESFHAGIGKAIVEFWKLPTTVSEAVEHQEDIDYSDSRAATTVVLTAGIAISNLADQPAPEEIVALAQRPDMQRLKLKEELIIHIADARESIRQELGLSLG